MGNRAANLKKARKLLALKNEKASKVYETEPHGNFGAEKNVQKFLNMVICGETLLTPQKLLKFTQAIEKKLGRKVIVIANEAKQSRLLRPNGLAKTTNVYSSRPLDIDILFYDDLTIKTPTLQIPHPDIEKRLFILEPLAEIAPEFAPLLKECKDKSIVAPHDNPRTKKTRNAVSHRHFVGGA